MNTLEGNSDVDALARSRLLVAELERDAVQREREAQADIRLHLERYKSLVAAIAQVIWTCDAGGEMAGEQSSWAAFTGQAFARYRGRGWLEALHPDDRASNAEAWARAVSEGTPYAMEHRLRRHDGVYRYFSVRAVPVFADDGKTCEWAGIHTDITDRKLTEQTLRDGERQFRELADSMPQIVWAAAPDGHFDYYNRRWYQFTGRPEGIAGDESWTDVVHPDDQERCLERWHSATRSGDPYEIEYRLRERTGRYHWFLRRALPVRDPEGRITRWYGTCTNIDAVKETEEGLRRANAEADAANRELEAFSYSVAHDLRTPLRSIDGFSQAIFEDNGDQLDAQGKSYLVRVRAAAQRMAQLIDDLLSLSRVSRVELRREGVNLTAMARGIGRRLHESDSMRNVELVVQEGLMAEGDASLLAVVVENLLGNAWKFTNKRSDARIELGVTSKHAQRPYFVRDNGAGFDMGHAGKLFGAFQRMHANTDFPGSGIGLATVHRIVRKHGGQIWAESEVGQGATFFFTLGPPTAAPRAPNP
jgi:PAS domain S-box-containing protein